MKNGLRNGPLWGSLAVVLMVSGACTREGASALNGEAFILPGIMVESPYTEPDDATKSVAGEVQYKLYWNAGDKIAIVNISQGNRIDTYTSTARTNENDGLASFKADAGYSYNPNDLVFAAYPVDAIENIATSVAPYKITMSLADNTSYYIKSNSPMFSRNDIQVSPLMNASQLQGSGNNLPSIKPSRMTAMLRVLSHISNETLSQEQVSALTVAVKGVAGQADIVFSGTSAGAKPSLAVNMGSEDQITVLLPNRPKMASAAAIVEFIPVFPIWFGRDNTRDGISFIFTTDLYKAAFHREADSNVRSNNVTAFNIFEGSYTRIGSEDSFFADNQWWYTLKAGGMNSPGNFDSPGPNIGSSAGGFVD